ncbi:DUF6713 family protein [Hyphomonas sp.]|uniref:DUF6713 family protein n=1 Tax=Hyphomonas sp. TaxID=87 RepID=UPI00391B6D35
MQLPSDSLYRLAAACLITHELESILWFAPGNPFGGLDMLEQIILLAHVPVVIGLLVIAELTRRPLIHYGICVFAVMHVALHWAMREMDVYSVNSVTSWVLILLAGIFGAAYLVPAKAR